MIQAGNDAREALNWINGLPAGNRDGKAVQILRRVFEDNFEAGPDGVITKRRAQPTGAIHNPHNPEAQWSSKDALKTKTWVGHKVQVAETVQDKPRKPVNRRKA